MHYEVMTLTSVNFLIDCRLKHACIGLGSSLCLHTRTRITSTPDVKRMLQGVSLPPEEVVAMPGVAGPRIMISKRLKSDVPSER